MTLFRAIHPRKNFVPAALLHAVFFVCMEFPPNFSASETAAKTPEAHAGQSEEVKKNSAEDALPVNRETSGEATKKPAETAAEAAKRVALSAAQDEFLKSQFELARNLRLTRQAAQAEPLLVKLLEDANPEPLRQAALLELALAAQDQNDLPRGQQIYSQFLSRWPNDARVPEILLRQGQLFRAMGLNSVALAKFYAVMTAAIALKNDRLDFYKNLVVQAQTEIAETHYQMGKYADAAEYFARLLKQNSPQLKRSQAQYRLIRSLSELARHADAVSQAENFLTQFADAEERPEVRFILAHELRELGRNNDSLRQVLSLLMEQKEQTKTHPEIWAYWQQRAGNEIANQLYREGDYTKALDVYQSLARLDSAATWQIPVHYQIAMTYERLQQPQLATLTYSNIVSREIAVGTNATPGLKSVFDMARWRINFLDWQAHAENSTREFTPKPRETDDVTAPKS